MTTDLASHFAAHLSITDERLDVDMDSASSQTSDSEIDASERDCPHKSYEIRFQGRQNNRAGIPMRLLVNNILPASFLCNGDETLTVFEQYKHDRILITLQWFGYDTDSEFISVKSDNGDPVTLRSLAEEIARCYLGYMRQRSGNVDSEDPSLGGVHFHQLYLLSLVSTNKREWQVQIQS